jgi:heme exporter protein A
LSARENIALAARIHGEDPGPSFVRAAERFELGAFADRPFRTCSKGQRQRVALARCLVHRPALLLLDEPTSGLDSASTERLKAILREEAARGAVVVIVTHDPGFGDAVAEDVVTLERGRRV